MTLSPDHASALESLQRRAPIEGRRHLVATVEYAFASVGITPEMADRLIPRAAAPATVVDAVDERVDCEKPIRDENGKFLGCEPGGGSGGGGGSGSPASETHEQRWAREKKEDISRRKAVVAAHREAVKVPKGPFSDAAEKHKEMVLKGREMNTESAEDDGWHMRNGGQEMVTKGEEEDRANLQEEVDAIARGYVTPPPREKLDKYIEVQRPAFEERLGRIHQEVARDHRELEQTVADLRGIDGLSELPTDSIASARARAGDEENLDPSDDAPSDSKLEDLEPDPDGDPAEYNEGVDEYNAASLRIHEEKQAAVKKARDAAERVLAMQQEHIKQLKALDSDHSKIAKEVEKEGEVDSSELLSEEASRIIDEEDENSEEYAAAESASSAAARMSESNSREEILRLPSAADEIKAAMADTKKIINALDRYMAKKKQPPPQLEYREVSDDDAEDEDEE